MPWFLVLFLYGVWKGGMSLGVVGWGGPSRQGLAIAVILHKACKDPTSPHVSITSSLFNIKKCGMH